MNSVILFLLIISIMSNTHIKKDRFTRQRHHQFIKSKFYMMGRPLEMRTARLRENSVFIIMLSEEWTVV